MAEIKTAIRAIRAKCLECSNQQVNEVRECPITECPLFPFRLGKNPYKKPLSPERRQILAERARANFHSTKIEEKTQERGNADGDS